MNTTQTKIIEAARTWLWTPFAPFQCVKGQGVDCVHLVAAIYREAGVIADFRPPAYSMTGSLAKEHSLVADYVEATGLFRVVSPADPAPLQPGDLLGFRIGTAVHHTGIVLGRTTFVHALRYLGVMESDLADPTYAKRLIAAWRLKSL